MINTLKIYEILQSAQIEEPRAKAIYMDAKPRILETVPVVETLQGKTVWEGEVFTLTHPKAKKGYAWVSQDGER
jgi:hypothetical protein